MVSLIQVPLTFDDRLLHPCSYICSSDMQYILADILTYHMISLVLPLICLLAF